MVKKTRHSACHGGAYPKCARCRECITNYTSRSVLGRQVLGSGGAWSRGAHRVAEEGPTASPHLQTHTLPFSRLLCPAGWLCRLSTGSSPLASGGVGPGRQGRRVRVQEREAGRGFSCLQLPDCGPGRASSWALFLPRWGRPLGEGK